VLVLVAAGGSFSLGWFRSRDHELSTALLLIAYNLLPLAWILRFQPVGTDALKGRGTHTASPPESGRSSS